MKEIWKEYQVNERSYCYYFISSFGRVMSVRKTNGRKTIIKPRVRNSRKYGNYYSVRIWDKNILVHRLVAKTFIPNLDNKPCVDHIDGNPENNNVENLRWVTYKENTNNPICLTRQTKSRTGTKHSEETKRKMSNARKLYWQQKRNQSK